MFEVDQTDVTGDKCQVLEFSCPDKIDGLHIPVGIFDDRLEELGDADNVVLCVVAEVAG